MKLEMKDKPGQLIAALKPISDLGGNIMAIIHQRDPSAAPGDTIDVQIMLDLPGSTLEPLVETLTAQGVNVVRIGEERLLIRRSVILIGHIMHTDLTDTVDRIDSSGLAEVAELGMVMPAINEPSSAKITLKSSSQEEIGRAIDLLRRVAREKDLLVIEPLEEYP
ncbi:MAG TPA: amino acid-binding protein [Methanoculleus sp.]|nr:amino acid-binding protein [Methanoculleus sp.]